MSLCRIVCLSILLLPAAAPADGILQDEFPAADAVLVEKGARKLHLLKDGEPFRSFDIALGVAPVGDKLREGDARTPEVDHDLPAGVPAEFACLADVRFVRIGNAYRQEEIAVRVA